MASNLYKIDGLQTSSKGLQPNSKRNLIAMASNLYKIGGLQTSSNGASNLIAKGT